MKEETAEQNLHFLIAVNQALNILHAWASSLLIWQKHWNKLKSLKVAKLRKDEWRMMNEGWMKNDEGWRMMKDDDFKLLRGFDYGQTDKRTDICDCRVAFATES